MSFSRFHPLVQQWFLTRLGEPTLAQARGWTSIGDGRHTLIAAPTGSGKTLAAFLSAIDELTREGLASALPDEVRVIYVSPLKALSADIHKNLAEPRRGIRRLAEEAGLQVPQITAAVRTGDTTTAERAAMLRTPPHILVTTPESLYLLLTVGAQPADAAHRPHRHRRRDPRGDRHAARRAPGAVARAAPAGRGAAAAADRAVGDAEADRRGGAFPAPAGADCAIVDEGHRRAMDLAIEIPRSPLDAVMAHEVWEEYYDRLAALVRAHRTTLVFVNTRRMAERLARHLSDRLGEDAVTAHHGSLSKETRLDAETRLKSGELQALVATASLELGIDIGHVDLVCQIGSPHRIATLLQRVGRSGHTISGTAEGTRLPDHARRPGRVRGAAARGPAGASSTRSSRTIAPLDVLAQQIVAECASRDYAEDELFATVRRAWPYRDLSRDDFDAVLKMAADGFSTRRGRRAALLHRDEVNATVRGRRGARLLALTSGGAIPEVADYRVVLDPGDTFVGTLNEDFAIESHAGDIFQLGNASWRILQVAGGTVRVADAHGAAADDPVLARRGAGAERRVVARGERPQGRRRPIPCEPNTTSARASRSEAITSLCNLCELRDLRGEPSAVTQLMAYLEEGRRALGVIPTQQTLVLERFFDESGGMQLVLHAPFGSRINKAWALALRKRFCRQFNFELQAAATEDALMLSLGPQHSFPLADVFRYLHPETTRDVLVQAFLDAPVFETRWRWNATLALAVPRRRGGRKLAPQLQRMLAEDLLAAVFPDAAACLENIPGDRQIPDHPLVSQTVRDCLEEAMDFDGLRGVLERIHRGELRAGRQRHAGAVGLRLRDPEREALCVPGRRAARGTAEPRGADAPRPVRGGRSRHARRGRDRARARRSAPRPARRRRAARRADDGGVPHRRRDSDRRAPRDADGRAPGDRDGGSAWSRRSGCRSCWPCIPASRWTRRSRRRRRASASGPAMPPSSSCCADA